MDDRLLTILQAAHQFNLTTGLPYTAVARGELATIRLPPRARICVRGTDARGWTDGHPPGVRLDLPRLMRPLDRLSPGASGIEAFDLLQALNTGHTAGTLSTIHANGPGWPCDRSPGACLCRASTCRILRFGTASPSAFRCWCIWNGAANRRLMTDLVRAGTTPAPTPMTLSCCEGGADARRRVHGEQSMLRIGSFSDTSPRVGYLARYPRVCRRQPSTSQEVSASDARRGIQADTCRYAARYLQVSSWQRVLAMRVASRRCWPAHGGRR